MTRANGQVAVMVDNARRNSANRAEVRTADRAVGRTGGVSPAQAASDDQHLLGALTGLTRVIAGAPVTASLTQIATFAAAAVPGADGAGLTMLESGQAQTVVASTAFVRDVDTVQYRVGQGPCLTAAATGRTVTSGSVGTDPAWPRFGPRVRHFGVHSVLSLPLTLAGDMVGTLNIYARPRDVFTAHAVRLGETFADSAAVAVLNARTLLQAHRLNEQLKTAMVHRAVIDHAIGILISRQGGDPHQAFTTLRMISQRDNIKVSAVATSLVADAAHRARKHRSRGLPSL